jgi:hypothetical protein
MNSRSRPILNQDHVLLLGSIHHHTRAHILSVFLAGILGFSIGCILHAFPMTASFVYIDVVALVLASVTAAVLTAVNVLESINILV